MTTPARPKTARVRLRRASLAGTAALLVISGSAHAYQRPGRTELASLATSGAQGDGWTIDPEISRDGRFVVFGSSSTTLVPDDTNGHADIFVHDRTTRDTERVSVASDGSEANAPSANGISNYAYDITPGGRYVVFVSDASNLVVGDTNGASDVFLHDRQLQRTERVSVASNGGQGDKGSSWPSMSTDGRYVAFASSATNLVSGDTNGAADVFVRDRSTGITERVSVSATGSQGTGTLPNSDNPSLSGDGRYVAFASNASNLVASDGNTFADIFVRDRAAQTTERVSLSSDGGPPNEVSHMGEISDDGRFVVFDSQATNIVPRDTNGAGATFAGTDVFVFDRVRQRTERVSVRSDGSEPASGVSSVAHISPDGRYVSFQSEAEDLVPNDTNTQIDTFIYDRVSGAIERTSVSATGSQANGQARDPSVSLDGRYVVFSNSATNLVPGDLNNARDAFVRDRGPSVGIGGLSATSFSSPQGPKVTVSGWGGFSGRVITEATDPSGDAGSGGAEAGAEIVGASVIHRPEAGDLVVRIDLDRLPNPNPACGKGLPCPTSYLSHPGVVYGLDFTYEGVRYQVRAIALNPRAVPPSTADFSLYRCMEACVEVSDLSGGIGTAGTNVVVSVPLSLMGPASGVLSSVRAHTGFGAALTGPATPVDEAALASADVTLPFVRLGIAPPAAAYNQVPFSATASLSNGAFVGTLNAPAGQYRVWADACFGACQASSVVVG